MSETSPAPATPPATPRSRGPGALQLGIVVVILAAGILVTALTSDVTRVSEPGIRLVDDQPFLPATAGGWTGGAPGGLTKEERAVLPADTEGVRRAYTDKDGHTIYCSIVLAGRDVTSIHRPELCLTGQGWKLESVHTEEIPTPVGTLAVSRLNASSSRQLPDGQSSLGYSVFVYWFVGKNRTTPYHWQRIWWTTVDRVLHNRNHRWAYFLVSAFVTPDETSKDPAIGQQAAMQTIRRFVGDLYPQVKPL